MAAVTPNRRALLVPPFPPACRCGGCLLLRYYYMDCNEQRILVHRLNVISRTVKHFGLGRVYIVLVNGGGMSELQIVRDDRVNYRFATIDKAEQFTDSLLLRAEIPDNKLLRSRKAVLITEKSRGTYDLPSRINDYEDQTMLQQRADKRSEFPHGAEAVRHGRQGDTAAGVRTGKSHGTNVGATAFGSVVATHGERRGAVALV